MLRPHLRGVGRFTVRDGSGTTAFDGEVTFEGGGLLSVVDASGHPLSIDKVGHLARSFEATDERIREEILVGTGRALDDLRDRCGLDAYLNYGMLLGAVRDGAMIAHDSDSDLCYVSRTESPADLIAESYRIERRMRELGWDVLRMSGGDIKLLLPLSDGRRCHIDVFVAFWVGGTFFQLGNRSGTLSESAILPVSTIELHGHTFAAPARPEEMLRFVYGPGWRVPDPAFKYADPTAGIRRLDGWLRGFRTLMGRWSEFHGGPESAEVPRKRSEFAIWVRHQVGADVPVVDLGAGNGRDSVYFASYGHRVISADFSRISRRQVKAKARRRQLAIDVQPLILGELRTVLSLGAVLAREPHHLYARHLVGCLDAAERANLWRLARMALRGGGSLFLEFSSPAAGAGPPPPMDLVRRVQPDLVRREIEAAGGTVVHFEERAGHDSFDQADPSVCRMVVRWSPTTSSPTHSKERP
ncbi:class I SAM-dependent methyltransferase [Nocardioides alcanivorans]|uniref:class I SAM-dependent methyltransferase n=1 Tax=Nocardioides alcanivorans TaxID=2897352 RepID=UPI001F325BD4|nr:class I SAM-dependent methyltransferase [Nocardioides alcanivorans]